jgi:hypothetical protein
MSLWDLIDEIKDLLHADPLRERTWICEPLLVIDEDDQVAYLGNTTVQVKPLSDTVADLRADGNRDGWHPSLIRASVEIVRLKGTHMVYARPGAFRGGLCCKGCDIDGNAFTWYINGAAEHYSNWHFNGFDPATLPDEEPIS